MPKILDKSVEAISKKGVPKSMAYGMAVASLQKAGILKEGTVELTEKGKKMNKFLTPNQLAGHNKKKKVRKKGRPTGTTPSKATRGLQSKRTNTQKMKNSKPKK